MVICDDEDYRSEGSRNQNRIRPARIEDAAAERGAASDPGEGVFGDPGGRLLRSWGRDEGKFLPPLRQKGRAGPVGSRLVERGGVGAVCVGALPPARRSAGAAAGVCRFSKG